MIDPLSQLLLWRSKLSGPLPGGSQLLLWRARAPRPAALQLLLRRSKPSGPLLVGSQLLLRRRALLNCLVRWLARSPGAMLIDARRVAFSEAVGIEGCAKLT